MLNTAIRLTTGWVEDFLDRRKVWKMKGKTVVGFALIFVFFVSVCRMNTFPPALSQTPNPNTVVDEQFGLTFTQDFTSLTYNVTAVQQVNEPFWGMGPAYLLNGLSDQGYWYQVGLSWNWVGRSAYSGYTPGFNVVYAVFGGGTQILPSGSGAVVASLNANQGDIVQLTLNFTRYEKTGGNVVGMYAYDWNTGAASFCPYSSFGATRFIGLQNSYSDSNGYFSGLMTEQYYDTPYYGNMERVVYSNDTSALSSAWMWIDEFYNRTQQPVFPYSSTRVSFINYPTTQLQSLSSQPYALATEDSSAYQFITGAGNVTVSPGSAILTAFSQSVKFTASVTFGTPPYTYQWYLNDAPVSGATGRTWAFTWPMGKDVSWTSACRVYVEVFDSGRDQAWSNTATVAGPLSVSISLSVPFLMYDNELYMYMGQNEAFIADVTFGTPPYTYKWYAIVPWYPNQWYQVGVYGGGLPFTPTQPGCYKYYVIVSDSLGAQATSDTVSVEVDALYALISPPSAVLYVGEPQQFMPDASLCSFNGAYAPVFTYQWYLDDVAVSGGTAPPGSLAQPWTFTPSKVGSYSIYLKVTDSINGATAQSNIVKVTVNPYAMKTLGVASYGNIGYFYVPNVPTRPTSLKIEMLFNDPRLTGDQIGGMSPYGVGPWPDGKVTMQDVGLVARAFGSKPGDPRWNSMADVVPNQVINMQDIAIVAKNINGNAGYVTWSVLDVTVQFSDGTTPSPDSTGSVTIPVTATNFTVYLNGSPVGAMVTFWP
jgi:hypothetical protein